MLAVPNFLTTSKPSDCISCNFQFSTKLPNWSSLTFLNTIFVSSHMYPENPDGTQVIVSSMNMGYISDTVRNRTHDLFRPKRNYRRIHVSHCVHVSTSWMAASESNNVDIHV